jgi:hypothetical protein
MALGVPTRYRRVELVLPAERVQHLRLRRLRDRVPLVLGQPQLIPAIKSVSGRSIVRTLADRQTHQAGVRADSATPMTAGSLQGWVRHTQPIPVTLL